LAGDAPARARHLGEIIRAEDGVGKACDILEKLIFDEMTKLERN
jgi:hypothetical protein